MSITKKRDLNLDLIRALAGFLVIAVHSMLSNGYYETEMIGKKMLAMTIIRTGCMVCVPLFLLLTGYLCHQKKWSLRYYLGISQILLTYMLCSVLCLVVRVFVYQEELTVLSAVKMIGDYTAIQYAWYIEMYLGLFLLIPFLNVLYHGLDNRHTKQVLIVTLFAMTSLPSLVNVALNAQLLPIWWEDIYPITYYMIGAYLAEYRPTVRWRVGVPTLIVAIVAVGYYNYVVTAGGLFVWARYNAWMGAGIVVAAVLIFVLVQKVPLDGLPELGKRIIVRASNLSLGIYLVSWCFDHYVYQKLDERVVDMPSRLWYLPLTIPVVYLCSAVTAQLIEWVRIIIIKGINRAIPSARLK